MVDLPETLPGHYETAAGREMLERYAGKTRAELCGGSLTDTEAAFAIAMLSRDDLSHEAVLTIAKDRIRWLSARVAVLEAGGNG